MVLLAAALAVAGGLVALFGLYLTTLAIAYALSLRRRRAPIRDQPPSSRLAVLIPAHDEQQLIGRCVTSLLAQGYPNELLRIIVIADNCTDRTAEVAGEAGAEVLVRDDSQNPGKGQALRWAIDILLAQGTTFDALVIVDADSTVEDGFLSALELELAAGNAVVQADYTLEAEPGHTRSELIAAAFLLFHRVRLGGRRLLGMPAFLVGNGMLFSRQALIDHPWGAFSGVEDLEHTVELRLAGVRPRFAPDARIHGAAAATSRGVMRQRVRWEGGRFHVIKTHLPQLARATFTAKRPDLLDAALDLATLPLGILAMIAAAGTALAGIAALIDRPQTWVIAPWLLADALIAAFVVAGLFAARVPASTWLALLRAPAFLAWKLLAYRRILRRFDPSRWDRSDRAGDAAAGDPTTTARIEVGGVPIDTVDFDAALQRTMKALDGTRLFQTTTVNLDFVVQAQKDASLRESYRRSDLNVADGAPVVWLGRLVGAGIPQRVAGADLVPALLAEIARSGHSVFLLGGENGVAEAAAARLKVMHPDLKVAGTFEPPRAAVQDMDNQAILARLAETRPDLLLVAFGNPKQERWIDMHREQLPVKVAIGVGCVFDLLAGSRVRAPRWMQAIGMEWAFRLLQEPRRLVGRYAADAAWLTLLTARGLRRRLVGTRAYAEAA